jgi:dihydrolipoamide dehydrogenase
VDTRKVDVAIIGAGSAGLNARREVDKAGGRPLLIESGPYGTTCARVGCMPSKLLVAAADAAHEVASAAKFGIDVANGWRVDGKKVLGRVRGERDRFTGFVVEDSEALPAEQRLTGHARFVGLTTLEVDGHTRVDAKAIVIATGSSPVIPPPFDSIREHVLINDDIFELEDLPQSMAVIGTGIIGLELGQAMRRLGVDVVFFTPFEELGPFTDPEIKKVTGEILGTELTLQLKSEVLDATPLGNGIRLHFRDRNGAENEQLFEKVLVAAGRRPNLAGLDLEKAGLPLDDRGKPSWDPRTTQVADAPIFMAGDVSGHIPLLHEASDEGRIAGANSMLYPEVAAHVRRERLAIAFTNPQMAMVGQPYAELEPDSIEIGQVSFNNQGRARVMGQNHGLLRIYGDRKCCIIVGAEMITPRAEHLAHLLAWVAQERMTVTRALQMPVYHPVVEEGLRTALRDLARKLKVTGECRAEDMAFAPGI